jgi:hypothetical protein
MLLLGMLSMRTTRLLGATLIVKLVLGLFFLVGVSSVAAAECALSVEPRAAQAGSEFMLTGSGYTPDKLVLQRGNNDPVEIELDLGDADPFEIPIGSRPGDEGLWRATVSVEGTDCEASATFRVTLKNTDMIDDLMASPAGGGIPPIAYLLVIVGGFGVGAFAARRWHVAV